MTEETGRTASFERLAKIAALVFTAVGLVWGVTQFLITKRMEVRQPYLDMQLSLYQRTAAAAATIATAERGTGAFTEAVNDFRKLYWGEMILIESPSIDSAMSDFNQAIDADPANLEDHAYCLAHRLRASIAQSWDVKDWQFRRPRMKRDCEELKASQSK